MLPGIVENVANNLEEERFPVLHKWLAEKEVTADELGEVCRVYIEFMRTAHLNPDEKVHEALERVGWFKLRDEARIAYIFYIGAQVMGTMWAGITNKRGQADWLGRPSPAGSCKTEMEASTIKTVEAYSGSVLPRSPGEAAMTAALGVWGDQLRVAYGAELPNDYLTFDCETTGTDLEEDVPLEIGHCVVRDRKVVNRGGFAINWARVMKGAQRRWFYEKVDNICRIMRAQGEWRLDVDYLRKHGRSPHKVLEFYAKLFHKNREAKAFFAGHNAWRFDVPLLETMFCRLDLDGFTFGSMEVLDTGGMEKAIQLGRPPFPGETMEAYFNLVANICAEGVYWAMDRCIKKYDFVGRFGVDLNQTHQAEADAYCCHLLYEEHRVHAD
jgi:DNA polymerase III epsilon subunit-like protein